ncbi:Centrosomal protein cep57l1 [Triplophysa tibetana]|uniref:Centrosomal protein cep57l1 n=1 Tax=Triplophysa tibetana TaxID=1572043 RepID=A0A5A9NEU0_9TELE|nr:Centrosomal protein cep57l1 [Triplophysa tibetana]
MQDTNTFWRCVSSEPIAERSCRAPRPIAEQWGRSNPESMNDTTCLFFSVPLGFFNGIPLSLSIFLTRFLDMLIRMKQRSESGINTERFLMKAFRKPTPPHTHYELLSKLVGGWALPRSIKQFRTAFLILAISFHEVLFRTNLNEHYQHSHQDINSEPAGTLNLDSPSKQSYIGSFYMPPDRLSRPLHVETETRPSDRNMSGLHDIDPQLYRTVPDAGSRAVISALKTLQEKMRRIELERVQAAKSAQHLSQAAQLQDHPSAHRENDSTHTVNEPTQRKEKQLDYMKKMVACAERANITQLERQESMYKESTNTDPQIQAQLNKLERLEKEYLKLTSTQSMAERKIELLEEKLLFEEHQRKLVQEKADELQRELEKNVFPLTATTQPISKKKKKDKTSRRKSPSVNAEPAPPQYPLKAKRLPFVAGTSTSPSHSVNANVQGVLHMMKHRNLRLCERVSAQQKSASESQRDRCRPPSSPRKSDSTLGSLSEILLALQDELGQMSLRMEEKAAQISKLRKHKETVQKLSQPSSPKQKPGRAASVKNTPRAQSGVQAFPPSPVKASPSKVQKPNRSSQETLRLLRETQKLCSSLRRQDIAWET